jgi:outer membrane immunogenic protein
LSREFSPTKLKGIFMKRTLLALAVCVGAGSAALAADLPMAPPPPQAPAMYFKSPTPLYNWTGFYLGGNLGYGFSNSGSSFSDTMGSSFSSSNNNQFLGGGQVGVNWEFGPGIVIGAEADFDWLPNTQNSFTLTPPGGAAPAASATINNRWLTLADARLGYAWDRFLVYGKGGGAFVGTSNGGAAIAGTGTSVGVSGPSTNSGWNAGVGLEYAFWGTWSVKAEYDYVRLNSASYTIPAGSPAPFGGGDVINSNNRVINLVTVGLNYKFGPWW